MSTDTFTTTYSEQKKLKKKEMDRKYSTVYHIAKRNDLKMVNQSRDIHNNYFFLRIRNYTTLYTVCFDISIENYESVSNWFLSTYDKLEENDMYGVYYLFVHKDVAEQMQPIINLKNLDLERINSIIKHGRKKLYFVAVDIDILRPSLLTLRNFSFKLSPEEITAERKKNPNFKQLCQKIHITDQFAIVNTAICNDVLNIYGSLYIVIK